MNVLIVLMPQAHAWSAAVAESFDFLHMCETQRLGVDDRHKAGHDGVGV
jgi:hypothetical protein